ncbi:MAG: hypothetical protein ABIN58_01045, partial [candidate division WOR-3 bacterium]
MKRKIWLICSILAIITAVILISTSVAFGASQSWFLRSDMIMVRNNPVMSSGSVDINQNQSVIWKSNETAASDVTFPSSSPWVVHLKVQGDNNQYANPWPSGTYTFDVGFYNDSSSSFTAFNTQTGLDFSWSGNVLTVEIQT